MKKIELEKLFVILGIIFGSLFIFIIPPFQSPDEDSHFKKAYSISNLSIFASSDGNIQGLYLPVEMQEYISNKLGAASNRNYKYSYSEMYNDQLIPSNFSNSYLYEVSTSLYTPVAHVVPAIGILSSKIVSPILVNGSPSTAMMLSFARCFCLILYLVLGYFAIKHTPVLKKSMFTILLLPMSLYLGSMVSYDGLLLCSCLLVVSFAFKLIYDKDAYYNYKFGIIFSILGYILLNIKIVYFPFMFLLFLIPKEKFNTDNIKKKLKSIFLIFGIIILFTLLMKIPNLFLNYNSDNSLTSKQLSFIISHPFSFCKTLLTNIFDQLPTQLYWLFGNFGLLDTYLPPLIILLIFINLNLVFISDGIIEKIKFEKISKLFFSLIFVFAIVAMYSAMYLIWTVSVTGIVGGNLITGVQGRYFIPVLICIPVLVSTRMFKKKKKINNFFKNYFDYGLLFIILSLFISVVICAYRFII